MLPYYSIWCPNKVLFPNYWINPILLAAPTTFGTTAFVTVTPDLVSAPTPFVPTTEVATVPNA